MKLTPDQRAWLAGLLEGEGTFNSHKAVRHLTRGKKNGLTRIYLQPRIQLQMSDKDVVARVAALTKSTLLGPYSNNRSALPSYNGQRACWVVSMVGKKAVVLAQLVYDFMGARRKAQIDRILREYGSTYLKTADYHAQRVDLRHQSRKGD